jgi:hypothetical protein
MFKFLLVAAFAALQLCALPAALARPQVQLMDVRAEFEFACSVMQYDCSDIEIPQIIEAPLFFSYGYLGMYDGYVLYVDNQIVPYMEQVYVRSVIAHELTHYLDHMVVGGSIFESKEAMCATEWNGWRVGNAYVTANGRPDFADYEWNVRYQCYQ